METQDPAGPLPCRPKMDPMPHTGGTSDSQFWEVPRLQPGEAGRLSVHVGHSLVYNGRSRLPPATAQLQGSPPPAVTATLPVFLCHPRAQVAGCCGLLSRRPDPAWTVPSKQPMSGPPGLGTGREKASAIQYFMYVCRKKKTHMHTHTMELFCLDSKSRHSHAHIGIHTHMYTAMKARGL